MKNITTTPIYYKTAEEMDKPASELLNGLRNEIDNTRGKLQDIMRMYAGYKDRLECMDGLLTCGIVTLYYEIEHVKKVEDINNIMENKS